jgi:SAM-dependent methyltransferase
MTRDIDQYAERYRADYGFEEVMVHYRRDLVIQRLLHHRPRIVIEVGCGIESALVSLAQRGGTWTHWHVVEPASAFVDLCRRGIDEAGLGNVTVHQSFFEDARLDGIVPDMIVCSGLLHEVPSSLALLRHMAARMAPGTILHANVPNASSFHRRLARAMGLISNLTDLSQRNVALDQRRVFDMAGLVAEIESCGMRVVSTGGLLVKPFSHAQMEALGSVLTGDVLDGLNIMAQEDPGLASEIWAEAVLA